MIKKKFCFFSPNLNGGGAERIISILASHLSKKDIEVDLLLVNAVGPYLNNLPKDINIIELNSKSVSASLPKIISYLKKHEPNFIFTSQMHCSAIAIYAAKLASVDTRVIIRQPSMLQRPLEKSSILSKIKKFLVIKSLKHADKIIVSSTAMLREFVNITGVNEEKIKVIYNPVPLELISKKSQESINHPWFSENQPPVLLAVGRLEEVKDYPTLLRAIAIVKKNNPIRLVILGEGKLKGELELLIKKLDLSDTVQMLGFVPNPYKYMRNSDIFVLSSIREGFPNSMVEAMACGGAIVSTNCGGVAEILEDGKWGKIVPIRNYEKMSKAIQRVLDSHYLPLTQNRALDFSEENVLADYFSFLELKSSFIQK